MKPIFPSFLYRVKNRNRHHGSSKYYFFIHTNKGQKMLFTETAIRQALKRADEQPEDCLHDTPINIKMILAERNQYYQRVARLSHTVNQLRDSLGKFKAGFFLTITGLPIGTFLLGLYFDKFVDFFAR